MRFRAALEGVPDLKKPVRSNNATLEGAEAWAAAVLKNYEDAERYPSAHVDVFETKEVFLWSRYPASAKKHRRKKK